MTKLYAIRVMTKENGETRAMKVYAWPYAFACEEEVVEEGMEWYYASWTYLEVIQELIDLKRTDERKARKLCKSAEESLGCKCQVVELTIKERLVSDE